MQVRFVEYNVTFRGIIISGPWPFQFAEQIARYTEIKHEALAGVVGIERAVMLPFDRPMVIGEIRNATTRE